jgi:hypothetical protein
MVTCKKKLHSYIITERTKNTGCPECHAAGVLKRNKSAKYIEYEKKRTALPKEKLRKKQWRQSNIEKLNVCRKIWKLNNPDKINFQTAKRRAAKLQRTPKWLTVEHFNEIKEFYRQASNLTRITGIQHTVDHIMPLQGKTLSGLHVPWNLQILIGPGKDGNYSKGNRV